MDSGYASRFAIEHAHYTRDLPFWREAARRAGGPVLDIGCASGRVALFLASAGVDVWGVDTSQAMLDELVRAAQKEGYASRITVRRQDMRDLELGRTFPLVIVPMNTFQLMHAPKDQVAALNSFAAHLAPEGELIIEVANPDFTAIATSLGELDPAGSYLDPDTGSTLIHASRYDTLDESARRATFTWRIDEYSADGASETFYREFDVRLFPATELRELLTDAGFVVDESLGDFNGAPLTDRADLQLHRCRLAA